MAVKGKAEITISDILDGKDGAAGKGIKSTAITYQAGTSGTTAPTGTWNTSVPSVAQGQYLWSRTVITYTDNSTSTTYSVAYIPKNGQNGATGSTGATGTGVASIVQQYYLSTSKTTQTGGSWVTSMPTWSSSKYLWTRYQINYKNPTSTAYTSPICDSSWEAVNEIQIGGRNLATKTSSEYTKPYTSFSGEPHIAIFTGGTILIDDLNVGDTVTIRLICKYTDIVSVSGRTAAFLFQGKGDVTGWDRGSFYSSPNNMSGTGEAELLYSFSINETHLKNTHWITSIRFNYVQSGSIQYKMLKAEKGNRATDWTPAPEDVQADIDEAAKTATNYMNFDNNGLVIGDLTKGTLGRNVLIDSDSVDIRNGTNTLATFSDNLIELGKGNTNSSIKLCNGVGEINLTKNEGTSDLELMPDYSLNINSGYTYLNGMYLGLNADNTFLDKNVPFGSLANAEVHAGAGVDKSYVSSTAQSGLSVYTRGVNERSYIILNANSFSKKTSITISSQYNDERSKASTIDISPDGIKIESGDLYDKYDKIFPNGVPVYGSGSGPDPNTTLDSLILSAHANAPGSGFKYIYTAFYNNKTTTSNRGQFAIPYGDSSNYVYHRFYYNGSWSAWYQLADQNDLNSVSSRVTTAQNTANTAKSTANNALSKANSAYNWMRTRDNSRLSVRWAQASNGTWTMYFYIDGTLVRTW